MVKLNLKKNFSLWFVAGIILALLLVIWLIFYQNPAKQVGFINLYSSSNAPSGFGPKTYLIDNQADLNNLLTNLYSDSLPTALASFYYDLSALPTDPLLNKGNINFKDNLILAVFLGERPTGGYDIDISHITSRWGKAKVTVLETIPGADCSFTQIISSPWRLLLINRTNDKIEIIKESKTRNCSSSVTPDLGAFSALPDNL